MCVTTINIHKLQLCANSVYRDARRGAEICHMIHRGEIVEKVVRSSGISLTKVASKMGKSRRWLYNAFETSDLSLDYILEFGKILHYDFSEEIPQITSRGSSNFAEPAVIYGDNTIAYWKDRYYSLLEEHSALLKEFSKKS